MYWQYMVCKQFEKGQVFVFDLWRVLNSLECCRVWLCNANKKWITVIKMTWNQIICQREISGRNGKMITSNSVYVMNVYKWYLQVPFKLINRRYNRLKTTPNLQPALAKSTCQSLNFKNFKPSVEHLVVEIRFFLLIKEEFISHHPWLHLL